MGAQEEKEDKRMNREVWIDVLAASFSKLPVDAKEAIIDVLVSEERVTRTVPYARANPKRTKGVLYQDLRPKTKD